MTRSRKISLIVLLALALIVIVLLAIQLWPLTKSEEQRSHVLIEQQQWYELAVGEETVACFTRLGGDSTLENLSTKRSRTTTTTYTTGRWVNHLWLFPSCRGLMIAPTDTLAEIKLNADSLAEWATKRLTAEKARTHRLIQELNYYKRIHDVTDEGYNMIANYCETLIDREADITTTLKALNDARGEKLRILRRSAFKAYYLSGDSIAHTKCYLSWRDHKKKLSYLRSLDYQLPEGQYAINITPWTKLKMPSTATMLKQTKISAAKVGSKYIAPKDVIHADGYWGNRKDGQRCGYGIQKDNDGTYYEGFWEADQRNGFGFSTSGTKLRAGVWKNDVFKGERLLYSNSRIYGIDISRFQHIQYKTVKVRKRRGRRHWWTTAKKQVYAPIDWNNMRITSLGTMTKRTVRGKVDYPVAFVYIKSTEGVTIRNPYYTQDYAAARAHNMHVGSYHFFSVRTTGTAQAKYFMANTSYKKGDFPPVLDVEPFPSQIRAMGGTKQLFANVRAFLQTVEEAWGVKPILYVSQMFVNKYLCEAPDIERNYQVWIARYGEYKPDVHLVFWQLSPDGRVAGIHGDVDINIFNGYSTTYQEFLKSINN